MMGQQQHHPRPDIDAEAATWVIRLGGAPLDHATRRQFDQWLAADPAHRDAFDAAQAVWGALGPAPAAARTTMTGAAPRRHRQRSLMAMAAAAAVMLAVGLGTGGADVWLAPDPWRMLTADHRSTSDGPASVTLADGSRVVLDASSAIAVDDSDTQRRVTLLAGRAYFDVAPSAVAGGRSFVVAAGTGTIRAIGTGFVADMTLPGRVTVTVTEHAVEVTTTPAADGAGSGTAATAGLAAGQSLVYDDHGRIGQVVAADVSRAMAWRQGRLVFDRQPLSEVVAVLQRHQHGRIMILNDDLAARRVSGVFHGDDPEAALRAITDELGATRRTVPPFLTLLY
ncbi:FecR domain-containing protein [Tistrella sp. BH-R2-4]|uniref:FecR domain-containing protein n=1 Tax=Tistrella arctica TaxID=3133430 RepID=A0ABU9YQU2_9PROT